MTDVPRSGGKWLERARLTPYELVFTEGDFESRVFPGIRAEAEEQALDALQVERFDFLSTAADVVREVTPEDAPAEALEQYRTMLFHAYHFWSSGRRLYVVDASVARYLVESSPTLEEWVATVPTRSVYVQLPTNLFWSSISAGAPPEPVDGFFATVAESLAAGGESAQRLEILLVLGIRRSRAGFSVIALGTTLDSATAEVWNASEREGGDFSNTLPGGEIDGLYSMITTAEVLKLAGRVLWYIDTFPTTLVDVPAPEPRLDESEPPSTRLASIRVTLHAPSDVTGPGE